MVNVSCLCLARLALVLGGLILGIFPALGETPEIIRIDLAETNGVLRPLHGINKGPLVAGGLIDLTSEHKTLGVPFTRLHDCHWPNPDVVDIHAIFPSFERDASQESSYDFALTDVYLDAVTATGSQIVYRLGESIEHTSIRRFVHPPTDAEHWADICLGIIAHYNEGWAGGKRLGIRYWEIWNEPENRPAMWSGNDEDYLQLYRATARKIKQRYPRLLVGGPAFGNSGEFKNGKLIPTAFVKQFLTTCQREPLPLDFFSWHCYTSEPGELVGRARAIRALLDEYGFNKTESHLNEWNYLPGQSWQPLSRSASGTARQRFYEEMGGPPGAAFVVASLLELQDAPVDVCNLFHGEAGGFGLFNEHGVPLKVFHGLHAFNQLLQKPHRLRVLRGAGIENGPEHKVWSTNQVSSAAGMNTARNQAALLCANRAAHAHAVRYQFENPPWGTESNYKIVLTDGSADAKTVANGTCHGSTFTIDYTLPPHSVVLLVAGKPAIR